jgi:hypothetical protein
VKPWAQVWQNTENWLALAVEEAGAVDVEEVGGEAGEAGGGGA